MPRIHLSPPDVGPLEREYLLRALESGWVAPAGPELDGFERDVAALTGWPGAVALSSGTAALHLALLVSGVRPGDDVLVSSLTFAASANAVVHCGANPVFVDSERSSWNMDPALLAEALTAAGDRGRLPTAAVVVDLYGQCADYDAIAPLCARPRRRAGGGRRRGARRLPRRACGRDARRHRRVLVQRQQDRHDERRRDGRDAGRRLSPTASATWRPRPGSRPPTSSTSRSGSTTA